MAKLKKPQQGWAWIPNAILQNEKLTLKAKGLWVYLNSKPDGWTFSIDRIAEEQQDGRDAVRSAIHELEEAGLLIRTRTSIGTGWDDDYTLRTKASVGNSYVGKSHVGKPDDLIKHNKVRQNKVKQKNKDTLMSAPAKPALTREKSEDLAKAKKLAERLKARILQNKPDRKLQTGWVERATQDIERMHRLDGREWKNILAAIEWSQQDDFWKQNILSGEKLRKHYDRMSDRARAERQKNATQDIGSAIFRQPPEQAVATARAQGLI